MLKCVVSLSCVFALISTARTAENHTFPSTLVEAVSWLESESHRLIRNSKRTMADGTAAFPPQVGIGYEAFWLRDFAYTLEGSIDSYSDRELLEASRLFIRSIRSDGAGVDCVAFDGRPIYKPGFGTMGNSPVADGSQFTVAWVTIHRSSRMAYVPNDQRFRVS